MATKSNKISVTCLCLTSWN